MHPFDSDHPLHGVIIARDSLECHEFHDPVEFDYYNSNKHYQEPWYEPNLCAYCANTSGGEGILLDKNLLKEWKSVLPLCEACRASGALPLVRYAVRNGAAQAKTSAKAAAVAAKAKAKAAVESSVATSAATSVAKPAAARKRLPAKRSLPQNNVPGNGVDDFLRSCSKIRSKKTEDSLIVVKCECH